MDLFLKRAYLPLLFVLFNVLLGSCSDKDDIDDLRDRVSALESAVYQLEQAYTSGKIIMEVNPVDSPEGYQIKFSDGTTMDLRHGDRGIDGVNGSNGSDGSNGVDGVTPMIKIDTEGYWIVSYDLGETYTRLLDENGNGIIASGEKGDSGQDGTAGHCVRVVVGDDGLYVFETYDPMNPDVTLEAIKTPFGVQEESVIRSIVRDDITGVISLYMADGSVFLFNLDVCYPTGLIILNEKIVLNPFVDSKVVFRINPSDAFVNFKTEGSDKNLQLDLVTSYESRSDGSVSYVTEPSGFMIKDVSPYKDADGNSLAGQYTATIESKNNGENTAERVCLVVTTKNGKGESITISSNPVSVVNGSGSEITAVSINGVDGVKDGNVFHIKLPSTTDFKSLKPEFEGNCSAIRVKGQELSRAYNETFDFSTPVTFIATAPDGSEEEYIVVVHYSDLPVVYITTPSPITSKEDWVADCEIQIWNAGEDNAIYESVNMKGRGNSTWGNPKKPYAIKLDKKATVLGMPKHKRWVLLANYLDNTNLRTEASMNLGRRTGLDYTPRTKFVEFVFNGVYQGLYQVTEQLKIDENRVDVGDNGFLLEVDARAGQDPDDIYFRDSRVPQPLVIKDPDVSYGSDDFNYIKSYISSVSASLVKLENDSEDETYRDLIDVFSFIDWYLVNEITRNNDACFFSSCYMNLERGEKLKMGPLWDFDLAIGNSPDNDSKNPIGFWLKKTIPWYIDLYKSPQFVIELKSRFEDLYNARENLYDDIRSQRDIIREAYINNELKWRRLNVGADRDLISRTFDVRVEDLIDWLETRFDWMKNEFDNL